MFEKKKKNYNSTPLVGDKTMNASSYIYIYTNLAEKIGRNYTHAN